MKVFKTLWDVLKKRKVETVTLDEKSVVELFDELEGLQGKKERMKAYLHNLAAKEREAQKLDALDQNTRTTLVHLASKVKALEEKKQNLKGRLIQNNAALMRIAAYEEELPDYIGEMQEAEKKKRDIENNLYYLNEEKEELLEERESLLTGYSFLKGLVVFFLVAMMGLLLGGFVLLQMLREKIWVYLSGVSFVLVLALVGMLYAKERIEKELKKNELLQKKVVRYLNKNKIRYFHQMQYLEFQYRKLGVDSSAKLEMYYNRYIKNKNNEKVYRQMNLSISDAEEEIIKMMKEYGIESTDIEKVTEWLLNPQKISAAKAFEVDEQKTNEQLRGLEAYEQELWKEVYALQQDPALKTQIEAEISRYKQRTMLDKAAQGA